MTAVNIGVTPTRDDAIQIVAEYLHALEGHAHFYGAPAVRCLPGCVGRAQEIVRRIWPEEMSYSPPPIIGRCESCNGVHSDCGDA